MTEEEKATDIAEMLDDIENLSGEIHAGGLSDWRSETIIYLARGIRNQLGLGCPVETPPPSPSAGPASD